MSRHDSNRPGRTPQGKRPKVKRAAKPPVVASCLPAALKYEKLGWSVTVLCPPDHEGMSEQHFEKCNSPGKAPWYFWKGCQTEPPSPAEIRRLYAKHPPSNVGIALGSASGLVRVDVEGPKGEAELLRRSGGRLPKTLEFTSGNGRGLLFAIPRGVKLRTTAKPLAVGQELRLQGEGAQTVLPPSRHKNGNVYRWKKGHSPDDIDAAPAPEWVIEQMRPESPRAVRKPVAKGKAIREGARNDTLARLAGTLRRKGASEEAIAAALLAHNRDRCDPPLGDDEVRGIAASVAKYPPADDDDGRPTIRITTREDQVNAAAVRTLAGDPEVYQRGGELVRVIKDKSVKTKGVRRPFAARIEALPPALLREKLAKSARWVQPKGADGGEAAAHPPAWCVSAVYARGNWRGVRRLEAIIEYPILKPDGTILTRAGYDEATGLMLLPTGDTPDVPKRPSRDDALKARDALLAVVSDFPFEKKAHRAAWLAALLTPLARFAFAGPSPLFLVDSNVRGAGKGLLLDCIGQIVTGKRLTVATYTRDQDELRKRVTSIALGGERLVLLDNIDGKFGNATLDAALTAESWKDRKLGVNCMVEAPLYVSWYATGNNVGIAADTARRTCHIRLESDCERPEERGGFKHPDLLHYVGANRRRLLGAALTILRAYWVAGRPDMELPPWGSFEGWSRLVRAAVVWVGLLDPGKTRLMLQEKADVAAESMEAIVNCWGLLDDGRSGLTAAEVIERLYKDASPPDCANEMRDALEALVGKPDARALGNLLRSYRRRIFAGKFIDKCGERHKSGRWSVYPATEF